MTKCSQSVHLILDQKSLLGLLLAKKWSERSQSHLFCIGKLTFERIQRKKLHSRTDLMLFKPHLM